MPVFFQRHRQQPQIQTPDLLAYYRLLSIPSPIATPLSHEQKCCAVLEQIIANGDLIPVVESIHLQPTKEATIIISTALKQLQHNAEGMRLYPNISRLIAGARHPVNSVADFFASVTAKERHLLNRILTLSEATLMNTAQCTRRQELLVLMKRSYLFSRSEPIFIAFYAALCWMENLFDDAMESIFKLYHQDQFYQSQQHKELMLRVICYVVSLMPATQCRLQLLKEIQQHAILKNSTWADATLAVSLMMFKLKQPDKCTQLLPASECNYTQAHICMIHWAAQRMLTQSAPTTIIAMLAQNSQTTNYNVNKAKMASDTSQKASYQEVVNSLESNLTRNFASTRTELYQHFKTWLNKKRHLLQTSHHQETSSASTALASESIATCAS